MRLPPNITDIEEWKLRVENHPNKWCRNTQLQIGKVDHLLPHLIECVREKDVNGLTFDGGNAKCEIHSSMCEGPLAAPFIIEECPPLSRILKSDYFCKNHTNFKDKNICYDSSYWEPCKGNSPSKCYPLISKCTSGKDNNQLHYITYKH